MRILYILTIFLSLTQTVRAQDTLTVMAYNLLNFPNSGCTPSVSNRYDTLKKIIQYVQPDIFVVNELQSQAGAIQLLNNSLNQNGITHYKAATFYSNQSSNVKNHNNMLYYNEQKLTLKKQDIIKTDVRDINRYTLYHKSPALDTHQDTLFLHVYVAHLKAGSSTEDRNKRKNMCDTIRKYAALESAEGFNVLAGDFNFQASSEPGFQSLTTGGTNRFADPVEALGTWNKNYNFRYVHTQSTRFNESYDCGVTGGMDDRFDMILLSENLINDGKKIQYLQQSYEVVGNDGLHYNQSFLSGANAKVSTSIASALFYMSDHLPVVSKLVCYYAPLTPPPFSTPTSVYTPEDIYNADFKIFPNPAQDFISLTGPIKSTETITLRIRSAQGQIVHEEEVQIQPGTEINLSTKNLSSGLYLIQTTINDKNIVQRFIKE
jgi:endonuclease/exonuclease/phosphatase family metal-dependent hydrolase